MTTRWLFGDQLGPHFSGDHRPSDGGFLMIESRRVFARRRFHRAKAHLVLSAMRHRARELGDRVRYVQAPTYAEVVHREPGPVHVISPTSYAALGLVERLAGHADVQILEARGFVSTRDEFERWARGRGQRRASR